MLKFQWDALRRGDHVLVHDIDDATLALRAGVVTLIDAQRSSHGVGIRYSTGTRTAPTVRPSRFAVHHDPIDDGDGCWRCNDNNQPPTDDTGGGRDLGSSSSARSAMIAVLSTPESMSTAQYDRLVELEASRASPPPGRRLHVCFGPDDHLMVLDLWDSVEALEAFAATAADEHIAIAPARPFEVHRLVENDDSAALRTTIAELREQAFFIRPGDKRWGKIHNVKEGSLDADKDSARAAASLN